MRSLIVKSPLHLKCIRESLAWQFICLALIILGWQPSAMAESARGLVESGNEAYENGRYDQASAAYEEAANIAPWSAVALFNKGNARYRMGDFSGAMVSFSQAVDAAVQAADRKLEALSHFNLGNSFFQAATLNRQDYKQALSLYGKSATHYRTALEIDPELSDAAHNLEASRRAIALLMAEQRQKQDQEKTGAGEDQEMADSLRKLLHQQEEAAAQSRELAGQEANTDHAASDSSGQMAHALAEQQDRLGRETEDLSKKLQDVKASTTDQPIKPHLDQAVRRQRQAAALLQENEPEQALPAQDEAAEELRQALAAMAAEQDTAGKTGQQREEPGQQQGKNGATGQDEAAAGETTGPPPESNGSEESGSGKDSGQEVTGVSLQTARDILEEEKRNSRARRLQRSSGSSGVEKDW